MNKHEFFKAKLVEYNEAQKHHKWITSQPQPLTDYHVEFRGEIIDTIKDCYSNKKQEGWKYSWASAIELKQIYKRKLTALYIWNHVQKGLTLEQAFSYHTPKDAWTHACVERAVEYLDKEYAK